MIDPIRRTEQEILAKISLAKQAAQERQKQERRRQLELQKEAKVNLYIQEITSRLQELEFQIKQSLEECSILGEEDPIYQDLQEQLTTLAEQIANPRPLAESRYQADLEQEERQLSKREWDELIAAEERRMDEALAQWREDLVKDLLETIEGAKSYFEASDIAVYLRDYREDLLATEQLEPILRRLIARINELNTRGNPFELRMPIETTLNRMVDFALNQRSQRATLLGAGRSSHAPTPICPLQEEHRQSSERPYEYRGLTGKVVVYGGHPRMHRNVVRRLPNVTFVWFDFDLSLTAMQERQTAVQDADVVILLTAYLSQTAQQLAQSTCDLFRLSLVYHHSTGIRSVIELIAVELQKHHHHQLFAKAL
ncbi:MAG: hypothetical protein OHK0012_05360 [Synechococcales cyanobacterium]